MPSLPSGKYPCPCCGYLTYPVPPEQDIGFICEVCFWENDPFIRDNDDPSDSNHSLTLNEARGNFKRIGACCEQMLKYVRPPREDERGD